MQFDAVRKHEGFSSTFLVNILCGVVPTIRGLIIYSPNLVVGNANYR